MEKLKDFLIEIWNKDIKEGNLPDRKQILALGMITGAIFFFSFLFFFYCYILIIVLSNVFVLMQKTYKRVWESFGHHFGYFLVIASCIMAWIIIFRILGAF